MEKRRVRLARTRTNAARSHRAPPALTDARPAAVAVGREQARVVLEVGAKEVPVEDGVLGALVAPLEVGHASRLGRLLEEGAARLDAEGHELQQRRAGAGGGRGAAELPGVWAPPHRGQARVA